MPTAEELLQAHLHDEHLHRVAHNPMARAQMVEELNRKIVDDQRYLAELQKQQLEERLQEPTTRQQIRNRLDEAEHHLKLHAFLSMVDKLSKTSTNALPAEVSAATMAVNTFCNTLKNNPIFKRAQQSIHQRQAERSGQPLTPAAILTKLQQDAASPGAKALKSAWDQAIQCKPASTGVQHARDEEMSLKGSTHGLEEVHKAIEFVDALEGLGSGTSALSGGHALGAGGGGILGFLVGDLMKALDVGATAADAGMGISKVVPMMAPKGK